MQLLAGVGESADPAAGALEGVEVAAVMTQQEPAMSQASQSLDC